jgi:hypothetical protein
VGFVELIKRSPKWKKRLGIEYPYELTEGITVGYPIGNPDKIVPREIHKIGWIENNTRKIIA